MPTTVVPVPQPLEISFSAPIVRDRSPGGWTVVVVPGSGDLLGTRRPVKVAGTMDGHAFRATLLPMGDGTHMIPVRAALRQAVGKGDDPTDRVVVHLTERFG